MLSVYDSLIPIRLGIKIFKISFVLASIISKLLRVIRNGIIKDLNDKIESLDDFLLYINTIGGIIDIIAYIFACQLQRVANIPVITPASAYNELPNLPEGYNYSSSDICFVSWEKLAISDTVCCEKQLYSYKKLVECYLEGFKVPHNPNINIDFTKNVYKMPQHGIAEENFA